MRAAVASPPPPLPPFVLVQDGARLLQFDAPAAVLEARDPAAVPGVLAGADAALAGGSWVAGYPRLRGRARVRARDPPARPRRPAPRVDRRLRRAAGGRVAPGRARAAARDGVAARRSTPGPTPPRSSASRPGSPRATRYQAELHVPDRGRPRRGPAGALRAARRRRSGPRHAAYLDLGRFAIASASPELFFRARRRRRHRAADEGHRAPRPHRRRGRAAGGGAPFVREGARREPDDRRHAAQRPRPRGRGRQRRGRGPLRGRDATRRCCR